MPYIKDPSNRQRCHKCKKRYRLADGGFLEELDAKGRLVFVCENCEPNMAPRDSVEYEGERTNKLLRWMLVVALLVQAALLIYVIAREIF